MELPRRPSSTAPSRASLILGLYGALAAVAFLIGGLRGDLDLYRMGDRSTPLRLVTGPLVGIAVGLVAVFVTRMCVHRFTWARQLHRDFRGVVGGLGARDLLVLAGASSVGEELLFRGALLPWLGLVPTTLVFGLLHVGPGMRFLAWTASALVVGLAFGGLVLAWGDLGPAIAAHFVINYLNLGYIARVELPA